MENQISPGIIEGIHQNEVTEYYNNEWERNEAEDNEEEEDEFEEIEENEEDLDEILNQSNNEKADCSEVGDSHYLLGSVQIAIRVCDICMSTKRRENFVSLERCSHWFCKSCMRMYLTERIQNMQVRSVTCPKEGCKLPLDDEELRGILPKKMYRKYEIQKEKMNLNANPDVRWCVRTGCEKFIIRKSKSEFRLECDECGQMMCANCLSEWHEGLSCEEAVDEEYKKYTKYVTVRNCPKCKRKIEKNGGCNLIECVFCEFKFCWICGKKFKENHYKWWNFTGCPGMQLTSIEPVTCSGKLMRIINKTVRFFLFGLLILLALPLIIPTYVLLVLFFPVIMYHMGSLDESNKKIEI